MPDGGTVVAGDVVLVAQDDGDGLVVDTLIGQKNALALGALRSATSVDKVDRSAQNLLGGAGEDAVGVHVRFGLAT